MQQHFDSDDAAMVEAMQNAFSTMEPTIAAAVVRKFLRYLHDSVGLVPLDAPHADETPANELVEEAAVEDMVPSVTEAKGYLLHLSAKSPTGYKGVSKKKDRFRVRVTQGGVEHTYGTYSTAVEAAVAYAHAVKVGVPQKVEGRQKDGAEAANNQARLLLRLQLRLLLMSALRAVGTTGRH